MVRAGLMPERAVLEGHRGNVPDEVAQYIDNLRWAQEVQEINEVLERRVSKGCYEYIKQRARQPRQIEELLSWIQQYGES